MCSIVMDLWRVTVYIKGEACGSESRVARLLTSALNASPRLLSPFVLLMRTWQVSLGVDLGESISS